MRPHDQLRVGRARKPSVSHADTQNRPVELARDVRTDILCSEMGQPGPADEPSAPTAWADPATNARLYDIVERNAPVGVLILDPSGLIRRWGAGMVRLLGYQADEMVGRALPDVPGPHQDFCTDLFTRVMAGRDWSGSRVRCPRHDGSLADLDVSAHPLCGADGTVEAIAVLVRDVTEQARSQALHRRLAEVTSAVSGFAPLDSILRMVRDAVIEFGGFDRAGVFQVLGNDVLGAWGTDARGQPQSEAGLAETLDDWGPSIDDLASGARQFVIEPWMPDENEPACGQTIEHVVIAMRAGSELVGLISADNLLTNRPVTEADVRPLIPFAEEAAVAIRSIRLHERVKTYADDLAGEVARRTEELEGIMANLEQFSYRVAHDLRAPLRAIDGLAHLLAEDTASRPLSAEELGRPLDRISRRALFAGRLVDDLLTLARVGRRPFVPKRVDLNATVAEAWQALADTRKDRSVELTVGELPMVRADRDMLAEVLVRALDNALKFTRRSSSARIEVGAETDTRTGSVVLYIRDNGIGLNPDEAERAFGVFGQLNSPDEFEGTGIGLAIVKRIMDRYGGRVWIAGAPGQGATLHCSFPAN